MSLALIAELDSRDVAGAVGYSGLALLLRDVARISMADARRRIGHATAVTETPLVSGGAVPAALPVAAAALRKGVLGGEHVEVIAKVVRELPPHVPDADRELSEPVNELHLTTRRDGRLAVRGEFDPEASALITTVLSPLAKPRPSGDTGPDQRTAAERQGDALVEVFHLTADGGALPSEAGEKPHVLVTAPLTTLRTGIGQATLDSIGTLDAQSARRIACDARVVPVVLGSRSEPLDLGRSSYTVPTALRRALILRDRGCAFPGCARTHRHCHVTIFGTGRTADPRKWTIWCCCAAGITG